MDLEKLVLEWQTPLYHLAYRMLGNEADAADATQEVFRRLIDRLPGYDRSRPLKPWLFRLAANVIRNVARDRETRRRREREAPPPRGPRRMPWSARTFRPWCTRTSAGCRRRRGRSSSCGTSTD